MKHEVTSLNTKKALAESLKKIMQKKSFSKITVSEIIADCGVNRKTFYYHFEDIYALLKWVLEKEAVEVVKQFDLTIDYEEVILFVMDYIEKNEHIINCAFDAIGRDGMIQFFFSDFKELVITIIDTAEKELNVTLEENYKTFLCHFYVEAIAGSLIDWIKNRKERNREQVIQYLSGTIKDSLIGILEHQKRSGKKII